MQSCVGLFAAAHSVRLLSVGPRPALPYSFGAKGRQRMMAATSQAPVSAASDPSSKEIKQLAEDALVWSAQHGLLVADATPATFTHAPVSLLPTPFPRARFAQAYALAAPFGDLVAAVAASPAFLRETLQAAAAEDGFTGRLLEMLERPREHAPAPVEVALLRSDYMVDARTNRLLQIEINTIAASFAGLSALVSKMHSELAPAAGALPSNDASAGLASGLADAWREMGDTNASVLVVVQPGERNWIDQQSIQGALRRNHGVPTLRATLADVAAAGAVGSDGQLTVGGRPISVVYFRSGYAPADFPTEAEWTGRALLERSSAAQCPSLAWHLAGAKKIQQELARPGVLERFVPDAAAAALRASFAGLWALDGPDAAAVAAMAAADPEGFVLKPQREGGGNNFYGPEMAARLAQGDGLSAFILMERIRPAVTSALFMRKGAVTAASALSELGVYSVYLRRRAAGGAGGAGAAGGAMLRNEAVGHLLRTKTVDSNEGGVAAGFAVLDSPLLVD